jgi:hypothetical protein
VECCTCTDTACMCACAQAAESLWEEAGPAARAALAAHAGYGLVLCGHSLGAGAAAVLAVLLKCVPATAHRHSVHTDTARQLLAVLLKCVPAHCSWAPRRALLPPLPGPKASRSGCKETVRAHLPGPKA